jgi:hypothetical protein
LASSSPSRAQVCLNKIPRLLHPTDLFSTSSQSLLPPRPQDLFIIDSPSPPLLSVTPSKQPLLLQIYGRLSIATGSKPEEPAPTGDPTSSSIYRRRREASRSVGRQVWSSQRLGRPLFNRHKAQFLHPVILASSDTSAHRRACSSLRVPRWICCCSDPRAYL